MHGNGCRHVVYLAFAFGFDVAEVYASLIVVSHVMVCLWRYNIRWRRGHVLRHHYQYLASAPAWGQDHVTPADPNIATRASKD